MRPFTNAPARDVRHAATLLRDAHAAGKSTAVAGGGSDLLGMVKDGVVAPDMVVSLRSVKGADQVTHTRGETRIGGLITLARLAADPWVRASYPVLAEAAEQVATPQIRNVGTLAGNICQRPWCWYYRNGFKCFKNGGSTCYSASGENEFHAIFGGGPSYIVHPSDTATALVALGASFELAGPTGTRTVPAADFFILPKQDVTRENVMNADEILAAVVVPPPRPNVRSTYHKIMDREAWTHAVVSAAIVLEMDAAASNVCRTAHVVLGGVAPVPYRSTDAERALAGQRITPEIAARAGEAAVIGARPLAKNAYKVPLTTAMVRRTIETLAGV